jgi:hypothetical protein
MDLLGQSLINLASVGATALASGAAERFLFPLDDDAGVVQLLQAPRVPELPSPNATLPREDEPQVRRRYRWDFRPQRTRRVGVVRRFTLTLPISEARYRQAAALAAMPDAHRVPAPAEAGRAPAAPVALVTASAPEVDILAAILRQQQLRIALDPFDRAWHVLAFVQAAVDFRYDVEKEANRRGGPQHPLVTLHDGVGGDEDQAILAAAILARLGFAMGLVLARGRYALGLACAPGVGEEGYAPDVRTGLSYCYGEATATGWRFGTVPEYLRTDPVDVVPIGGAEAAPEGDVDGPE